MIVVKWTMGLEGPVADDALLLRDLIFVQEQRFYDDVEEIDNTAWHLVVYEDGKLMGCARLFFEEEGVLHAGRIAVRKEYRGKHRGSLIMSELEKKALEIGAQKIILGAQYQAVPFYEKQGYTVCSEEYLDQGYPHFNMEKEIKINNEGEI